jgi:phospholipid/cholesterol/gamma-HCH transport system substrate-binding protein
LQAMLVSLQEVLTDLRRTTPELPRLTKSLANTTESLPLLMVQTEQTLDNLDKLLRQLRAHWLLGGRRSDAQQELSRRLPALEITP